MRLVYLLAAGLLLAPTLVTAAKTDGEEFLALDLSALPDGGTYFLKCSNPHSKGTGDCGFLSLWQQSNDVRGLQSGVLLMGRAHEPDSYLLG